MKNNTCDQPASSIFLTNIKKEKNALMMGETIHDLTNQIAAVLCCAELLLQQLNDALLQEGCSRLITAAQKAADLINQLSNVFSHNDGHL